VPLIELPDTIDLDFDETELPDDGRHEPAFAAVPAPFIPFNEIVRLDPTRIELGPDPTPPKRRAWRGPLGSLLMHLLPWAVLISWPGTPLDIPKAIPIQLVIEQPPPPPPPEAKTPPAPPKKPATPSGLRASDDFAENKGPKTEKGTGAEPPTRGEPLPPAPEAQPTTATTPTPAQEQLTSALQPPSAALPELSSEPTSPVNPVTTASQQPPAPDTKMAAATPPRPPKPAPPRPEPVMHMPREEGAAWPLPLTSQHSHATPSTAALVGPNATRDEYCIAALHLVMNHINLLPLSLLGARHGDTFVSMRVMQDGTITSIRITHGSGYSDIDERIQQMVVAVGKLPPLPEWVPGPYTELTFHLHFPHPAEP
jgi:periplasmic protein TonB